jgi:hypothetical protein
MRKRSPVPMLLICAAVGLGCGSERGLEPGGSEVVPPSVFTSLDVRPTLADLFTVEPGNTVQLSLGARDQRGVPMPGTGAATYSSSAPEVAEVSSSGVVTGAAPGSAVITATFTLDRITRTASMIATVGLHNETPGGYPDVAGVYDLTAPITGFDPAWGDLTGYRYTVVLTLERNNGAKFEGTYVDLHIIGPDDKSEDWEYTGFVTGSLDRDGRVIIQLVGRNHTWTTWHGQGMLASERIVGRFGCCGHISGTFTADKR